MLGSDSLKVSLKGTARSLKSSFESASKSARKVGKAFDTTNIEASLLGKQVRITGEDFDELHEEMSKLPEDAFEGATGMEVLRERMDKASREGKDFTATTHFMRDAIDGASDEALESLPALKAYEEQIDEIEDEANQMNRALQESAASMTLLQGASLSMNIGPFNVGLKQAVTTIPTLIALIGSLTVAVGALGGAMAVAGAGMAGMFMGGLFGLAESVDESSQEIQGTMEAMGEVMKAVGAVFSWALEPLKSPQFIEFAIDVIAGLATVMRLVSEEIAAMSDFFFGLIDAISPSFWNNLPRLFAAIRYSLQKLEPFIVAFFRYFWRELPDAIIFFTDLAVDLLPIIGELTLAFLRFSGVLVELGARIWNAVGPLLILFMELFGGLMRIFNALPDNLQEAIITFAVLASVLAAVTVQGAGLVATLAALGTVLLANPVILLVAAIGAAITYFELWDEVIWAVKVGFDALVGVVSGSLAIFGGFLKMLEGLAGILFNLVLIGLGLLTGNLGLVQEGLQGVESDMGKVIDGLSTMWYGLHRITQLAGDFGEWLEEWSKKLGPLGSLLLPVAILFKSIADSVERIANAKPEDVLPEMSKVAQSRDDEGWGFNIPRFMPKGTFGMRMTPRGFFKDLRSKFGKQGRNKLGQFTRKSLRRAIRQRFKKLGGIRGAVKSGLKSGFRKASTSGMSALKTVQQKGLRGTLKGGMKGALKGGLKGMGRGALRGIKGMGKGGLALMFLPTALRHLRENDKGPIGKTMRAVQDKWRERFPQVDEETGRRFRMEDGERVYEPMQMGPDIGPLIEAWDKAGQEAMKAYEDIWAGDFKLTYPSFLPTQEDIDSWVSRLDGLKEDLLGAVSSVVPDNFKLEAPDVNVPSFDIPDKLKPKAPNVSLPSIEDKTLRKPNLSIPDFDVSAPDIPDLGIPERIRAQAPDIDVPDVSVPSFDIPEKITPSVPDVSSLPIKPPELSISQPSIPDITAKSPEVPDLDIPESIHSRVPDVYLPDIDAPQFGTLGIQGPDVSVPDVMARRPEVQMPSLPSPEFPDLDIPEPVANVAREVKTRAPDISLPDVDTPSFGKLGIPSPDVSVSDVLARAPKVDTPDVGVPSFEDLRARVPDVSVPDVNIPSPSVERPDLGLPKLNVPDIGVDGPKAGPIPTPNLPDLTKPEAWLTRYESWKQRAESALSSFGARFPRLNIDLPNLGPAKGWLSRLKGWLGDAKQTLAGFNWQFPNIEIDLPTLNPLKGWVKELRKWLDKIPFLGDFKLQIPEPELPDMKGNLFGPDDKKSPGPPSPGGQPPEPRKRGGLFKAVGDAIGQAQNFVSDASSNPGRAVSNLASDAEKPVRARQKERPVSKREEHNYNIQIESKDSGMTRGQLRREVREGIDKARQERNRRTGYGGIN